MPRDPQLGDPEALIDQLHWFTLVEAAARETGDPFFAIGFVEEMPWKNLGVLGYVALHSPTVGDALANLVRYFAVHQTGGRLALDTGAREARYNYVVDDHRIGEAGQNIEGLFAIVVRLIREATGDPAWHPIDVAFRHDEPSEVDRHRRFFRASVRFRQRTNTMTLAVGDLARAFITADAGLLPHLLHHAADCIARMPRSAELSEEVRRAVIASISTGDPTIDSVAARLGQSARSLQRRLQADDRSFKQVVEDTRLDLAQRYLADPELSLTETAFLLGYSDLGAFSRAFKRWTGKTAIDVRRATRTEPTAASSRRKTKIP